MSLSSLTISLIIGGRCRRLLGRKFVLGRRRPESCLPNHPASPCASPSITEFPLPRLFRLLEKKRGERRTGSNLVGSVGEALLYGALFLLGVTALSTLVAVHFWQPQNAWYSVGVGFWLMVVVLSSFVFTGGIGLIWTVVRLGISAERRSALATHASALDLVHDTVPRPRTIRRSQRSTASPTAPAPNSPIAFRLRNRPAGGCWPKLSSLFSGMGSPAC